ncbi:MAG: HDOD domain-containing protein [Candidatus Eisenbacteria bacterium]
MSQGCPEDTTDPLLKEKVRPVLNRVDNLPTLPPVVTRILSLVEDPKATGQQVAEAVSMDQAMVASILKIVNSPFYGLNRRISSISHAILLLGFRTIRNMALSATLLNTFGGSAQTKRFDRGLFWRHSIGCATTARSPCQTASTSRSRGGVPRRARARQVGRIIFDHYFSADFAKLLDRALAGGADLILLERETFGLDHAEVGRLMAQRWNFPAGVTEAIACHHEPSRARQAPQLCALIHAADELSHRTQLQEGSDPLPRGPFDPSVIERIGFTDEMKESFQAELEGELEKAEVFLNLLH